MITAAITCEWTAAYDALLAIESFAERVYPKQVRRSDPDAQQRYNDLAAIVLPLREAVDEHVATVEDSEIEAAAEINEATR